MEIQNILTLIQAFTEHSLTELNVEDSGVKVCLKREAGTAVPMVGVTQTAASAVGAGVVQPTVPVAGTEMVQPVVPVAGTGMVQPTVAVAGTGMVQPTVPVAGAGMTQAAVPVVGVGMTQAAVPVVGAGMAQAAVPVAGVEAVSGVESDRVVTSPLVGIFYSASSPEAEAFVKVGDRVKKGQVLGIIEAMKLMNEIESEYDGVVEAILVKNEDVVEYGQPLFRIR